jgi:hypothetical protein
LQNALNTLANGEVGCLRAGTYSGNFSTNRAAAATIRAYPGETPVIQPVSSYPLRFNALSANWTIGPGLKFTSGGTSHPTAGGLIDIYGSNINIIGNEITESADNGIFTAEESDHLTIRDNWIHDNGNLDINQDHGIYLQGSDHLVEFNLIQNHGWGFGIQMYDNGIGNRTLHNIINRTGYLKGCCGGIVVGGGGSGDYRDVEIAFNIITQSNGGDISNDRIDGICTGDIHDNDVEKPVLGFPSGCAINNS